MEITPTKIAVIGAGMVGSSFAFAAMLKSLAAEIILIDIDQAREEGEVMDLSHGLLGTDTGGVRRGELTDANNADVVVITAGAPQNPGQSRIELLQTNSKILQSITNELQNIRQDTIVLIASNPVDIITHLARQQLKLPQEQIIGSGTYLDSSRFRSLLATRFQTSPKSVHGYVLGEHGDTGFAAWSTVTIGGKPVSELVGEEDKNNIQNDIRHAAAEIIQRKKATYYGIAVMLTEITETILRDQHAILPLSVGPNGMYGISDISLSLPVALGRKGIEKIWELNLPEPEMSALQSSANVLKEALASLGAISSDG